MDHSENDSFVPFIDVLLVLLVCVLGVQAGGLGDLGDLVPPPDAQSGPASQHAVVLAVLKNGDLQLNGVARTRTQVADEWKANRPASVRLIIDEDTAHKHCVIARRLVRTFVGEKFVETSRRIDAHKH